MSMATVPASGTITLTDTKEGSIRMDVDFGGPVVEDSNAHYMLAHLSKYMLEESEKFATAAATPEPSALILPPGVQHGV